MNLGDFALGTTVDFHFTTRSFSTGAPTTLAGTPAVAAYPGNSTTEITAGITLTADFDARTGLNQVRIVATSGNGYAADEVYSVVITTGTVGGVSVVGEVVGRFTLEKTAALRPTTAGRTLDVTTTGEAGIDLDNTVGALAKGTEITGFNDLTTTQVENAVWDATQASHVGVGTTGERQERLDILATGGASELTPSRAANLSNLDAAVTTRATQAQILSDATPFAGANIDAAISTRATPTQVNTEVDTALADIHLDHLLAVDYNPTAKPGVATALLNELIEDDGGGVSRYTAGALAQAPSGGGGGDWTATEKANIRYRLGVDGTQTAPGNVPTLPVRLDAQGKLDVNAECDTALTDYDAVVPADLPANFADLAITVTTGRVTVGTNLDKAGYSISGTKTTLDALNDVSTAQVNAECDTALTDYGALKPTVAGRTLDVTVTGEAGLDLDNTVGTLAKGSEITGFTDLTAAQVNAEMDTALADIHLDHLLAVDYNPAAKPGVSTALFNELIENDGAGVSRYTAGALAQAPSGGAAPTAAQVADAVWDEAQADHLSAGSMGASLNAAGGGLTASAIADEVWSDNRTLAELSQAIPPATPTPRQALMLQYMALRNQRDTTASEDKIHNDGGVVITKATLTGSSTLVRRGKFESGP